MSIFQEYYSEQEFTDRFISDPANAIDVIIPVYHTNELWRANLVSIYREIPVKRLLISDGGVVDNSIDIVKEFPRVEIFNHRHYKTLGKCIAELIKEVNAEWFAYLHSDVYLPKGWFDAMIKYKGTYDWYGCPMNITVLVNYRELLPDRPYAGSQIGRKEAFTQGIGKIDDDYVYRQEDFVFNRIVEDAGFRTGKIEDTHHYHQVMYRPSKGYDIHVKEVKIIDIRTDWEQKRTREMQLKGIVKYLDPVEPWVIGNFISYFKIMVLNKEINYAEFKKWVEYTNIRWLPYISFRKYFSIRSNSFYNKVKLYIIIQLRKIGILKHQPQ